MVVVEKLIKVSHFTPMNSIDKVIDISNIFMKEIFRLHGMPKTITLDIDAKFTWNLWKYLSIGLEHNWILNYLSFLDREVIRRVKNVLEDRLIMYTVHHPILGKNTYRWWNLSITMVTKFPWIWARLSHCMEENVTYQSTGVTQ